MDPAIEDMGVPEFARLEIRMEGVSPLTIANKLRSLADALEAAAMLPAAASGVIAYRHIRAASAQLRSHAA